MHIFNVTSIFKMHTMLFTIRFQQIPQQEMNLQHNIEQSAPGPSTTQSQTVPGKYQNYNQYLCRHARISVWFVVILYFEDIILLDNFLDGRGSIAK